MTHRWGFDLDMAAVRLMRREAGQWREIVVEKIDGPDIEDRLRAMVDRIGDAKSVDLFLPRDQILYTDVTVTSEDAALDEIDLAMDGRTPYALSELEFDWEMIGPDTARVAAIARETLDEAAAFAEARGMRVAGFSSLADKTDFPRLPDFGGGSLFDAETDDEEETSSPPTMQFSTKRETSRPNGPVATLTPSSATASEPVLRVDDAMPVMQVRSRDIAPLDPGAPLSAPPSQPRVRTDIAASMVSPQAASLTPPAAVKVRRYGSAPLRTLAVFAIALLLTIGIAIVVWNILPMGPGQSARSDAPAQPESALAPPRPRPADLAAPETQVTALPPEAAPVDNPVSVPEPGATDTAETPGSEVIEAAPPHDAESVPDPLPDLPRPVVVSDDIAITAPNSETAPVLTTVASQPDLAKLPKLLNALRSGEGLPTYDPAPPLAATPQILAGIGTQAPLPSPELEDAPFDDTDLIYFASIEAGSPSADAIALPSVSDIATGTLPFIQAAPAPETDAPHIDELASATPAAELPSATDLAAEAALADSSLAEPTATGLPQPTEFAARLVQRAPRSRPSDFVQTIERDRFNGLTRDQLATRRPPRRPESAQAEALLADAPAPVSDLAVETSLAPRGRPAGFDRTVAASLVQREAERLTASLDYQTPDTSAAIEAALEADAEPEPRPQDTPRLAIPSGASVARQATIDDAIRLNKINLVGVYGTPGERRALVRLASGRYIKVKVGDKVDGGTVASITDSELIYRKGNRNLSLVLPRG